MRENRSPIIKFYEDERGQTLPVIALMFTVLLGMAGLVLDVGRIYVDYRQLQASTDAAALAGAQALPGSTAAVQAIAYGGGSTGKNYNPNMPVATMVAGYPLVRCLNTLKDQGIACVAPANGNALVVKQQISVPMYFARLFGTSTVSLTATATASMRGANPSPYNIVVVLDTTASMAGLDADSNCLSTRLSCATGGVVTLLKALAPCGASQASCGTATNGNVANSVDRVSLFTFPNPTLGSVSSAYDCSSSNPTIVPYTLPAAGATSYTPNGNGNGTYQVLDFQSDYRTSNTATSLSTGSNLTMAVGGKSGCTGIQAPGGQSTYYAGVVYAAQAALTAAKAANPGSENVMIILSDGDSQAAKANLAGGASTTSGVYPSTKNQCRQAITAAQAATAAGTSVYTVAYGATSSGCSTDSPNISPCETMRQMASDAAKFFSDYTATGGSSSCVSAAQSTTNLNQIFTQIAGDLTVARLIPDNTI